MSRYMIDTYAEYERVYNRPAGMTVDQAISEYMNLPRGHDYSIHLAKARYYYHTRTPYFLNWLNGYNANLFDATVSTDEDLYPLDVMVDLEESHDHSMNEGDTVVASIYDYHEVVQIKFIDGEYACVKTLSGSLKIFKVEDLRHIPKNF